MQAQDLSSVCQNPHRKSVCLFPVAAIKIPAKGRIYFGFWPRGTVHPEGESRGTVHPEGEPKQPEFGAGSHGSCDQEAE